MSLRSIRTEQRGIALILFSLMLFGIIGFVGLAVDVGVLYLVKGRLGAAVDAAALAGGRSLNLGGTVAEANSQASATASQFFAANFPTGYLGTTSAPTLTTTFTQVQDGNGNPNGVLDVKVTATVPAPTYFMRVFGFSSVTVAATGTASRRSLVLMLVLDKSSSMNTSTTPTACRAMVSAVQTFITQLSPYDIVGAVSFDYTAHLLYAPSSTFGDGSLSAAVGDITCARNTNTTGGLEMAYQQLRGQNLPLAENVIILFTDGAPNGLTADFPLRTQVDDRWGPAVSNPAPPSQSGSTYGQSNSCSNGANGGNNGVCHNEPAICTGSGTVRGTIVQTSGQNQYGGTTDGLFLSMDGDAAISYPGGTCGQSGVYTRQMIAYIPDTDIYGNSTHGVTATGAGPTVSSSGPSAGRVSRDGWLYQSNNLCSPNPAVLPNCKNVGDSWSNHSGTGSGSNYFTSGPYNGKLRPDQPNTVVAASMNAAMDEANRIRSDTTLRPTIHAIYLTGNGSDAVDREFLPIIANSQQITALPYDPTNYVPYTNPAYRSNQQHGLYLVTSDHTQLTALFQILASSVLRLSQ